MTEIKYIDITPKFNNSKLAKKVQLPEKLAHLINSHDLIGELASLKTTSIIETVDYLYSYIIEDSFPAGKCRDQDTFKKAINEWIKVLSGRYHWKEDITDGNYLSENSYPQARMNMIGKAFITSIHKDYYYNYKKYQILNKELKEYCENKNYDKKEFITSLNPNYITGQHSKFFSESSTNRITSLSIKYDKIEQKVNVKIKLRQPKKAIKIFLEEEFQESFKQIFTELFRLEQMGWSLDVRWSMRDSQSEFIKHINKRSEQVIENLDRLKKISNSKNYKYNRDEWLKAKMKILNNFSDLIGEFEGESEGKNFSKMARFLQHDSTMEYDLNRRKNIEEKKEALNKEPRKDN
tara:strand:- start:4598 stop:5647 length:1050 start_codon:yes stop_codon:yes gene_type:complete